MRTSRKGSILLLGPLGRESVSMLTLCSICYISSVDPADTAVPGRMVFRRYYNLEILQDT